jgi:hypothetical protein
VLDEYSSFPRLASGRRATYAEIGRECGCDPRTVRKYLAEDASSVPPAASSRLGSQPRLIEPFVELVESWLRTDLGLKASVIHERLVTDYGFTGHYQRVKMFAAEARPRIAADWSSRMASKQRFASQRYRRLSCLQM